MQYGLNNRGRLELQLCPVEKLVRLKKSDHMELPSHEGQRPLQHLHITNCSLAPLHNLKLLCSIEGTMMAPP